MKPRDSFQNSFSLRSLSSFVAKSTAGFRCAPFPFSINLSSILPAPLLKGSRQAQGYPPHRIGIITTWKILLNQSCSAGCHGLSFWPAKRGGPPCLPVAAASGPARSRTRRELSKTTLFSLMMLERLQFPAPNRNRNRNRNPPLRFIGNTRGLRLRKTEALRWRLQITISTDFTEVCHSANWQV